MDVLTVLLTQARVADLRVRRLANTAQLIVDSRLALGGISLLQPRTA